MFSGNKDRLDLFCVGVDSGVLHKSYNGSRWTPSEKEWENLGGQSIYDPVYLNRKGDCLDLVIVNPQRELLYRSFDGRRWSDWQNLGGTWAERPSLVSCKPDRLDIFMIGRGGNLYRKELQGNHFSKGFENMGGQFLAPVAAVARDIDRIDLFGTTPDHKVHHKWFDGQKWGPKGIDGAWDDMGGTFYEQPKAVSWDPKRIDLFAIGDDSGLYTRHWDGSKWSNTWESLGGVCQVMPEVVSWGMGRLDVFVIGTDHSVYHKYYDNGWHPKQKEYEFMSGVAADKLTALSVDKERIDLLHIGTDSACYIKSYNGKTGEGWKPGLTGYESLGGICLSGIAGSS